jgi:hypothetical protein
MHAVERIRTRKSVSLPLILCMMGGVFIIVGGIDLIISLIWNFSTFNGLQGGLLFEFTNVYPHWLTVIFIFFSLVAGVTVIISASKMHKDSEDKVKWGLLILLGSIAGLFCIGGFGLGAVLGIVGAVIFLSGTL